MHDSSMLCPIWGFRPSGKVDIGVVLDDVPGSSVVLGLCWDVGATAPPAPTCAYAKSYRVTKDGTVSIPSVAVPGYGNDYDINLDQFSRTQPSYQFTLALPPRAL